ncbi:MAG TPA: hypothetical protein DHW82_08755 [Spirochaetia bacterium]|nr:MAG: hypothetical protein A2Y41_05110 [Spirochaetes bacterium GWB1_36_13]HCL57080.1 hypothetical protein [Spirochaetia bacterium]
MIENEIEWIEALINGHKEALEPLIKQYNALVYRVLLRFSNNPSDLDDLIQEVWIKVFYKIKELKKKESFRAWLIHIAYYMGIDYLKQQKSFLKKRQEVKDFFFEKNEEIFEKEIYKTLWEELKALKDKYQLPLIMYFFEQFSYDEIAEVSGIKTNTIKSLIKRGKDLLKEKLKKRGLGKWTI